MISLLATSLSGSEHIVSGGVRNKFSYNWETLEEALAHLARVEWKDVRTVKSQKTTAEGKLITTWSNDAVTEHVYGSGEFTYLKGGPASGRKLSKSEIRPTLNESTPKLQQARVLDSLVDNAPLGTPNAKK